MSELRENVLIVDDTAKNIQVLGSFLREKHYNVSAATDGHKALQHLAKKKEEKKLPDLILLDIMMPDMDGFQTCQKIKEDKELQEIPIIFLTARTEMEDIIHGFDLGAVDYVTKPFNSAELLKRVETHLELKRRKEEILNISEERKELIHIMSHDLLNPLSFIQGVIDLVEIDKCDLRNFKDDIKSATNRSIDLIGFIRQIRALEEKKEYFKLSPIPLSHIINEALIVFKNRLEKKNIQLNLEIDDTLQAIAEPVSFSNSVFNNLLSNAIKFSYENSQISIRTEENDNEIALIIKDHGMGIPEVLLKDIFDIHKATSRPGTTGEQGTGFGMPLVKKFVTAYGGRIEIESYESDSNKGRGTEIRVWLQKA